MVLSLKSPPVPREKPPVPGNFAAQPDVPAGVQETSPAPQGGFGDQARSAFQNPAVMSALMQFGINLGSGSNFFEALGAAGQAAGRVDEMTRRQQEYDLRAEYASQDQAMQQGRYNMALQEADDQVEERKYLREDRKRRLDLQERNIKRLEEGASKTGGLSATTLFSNQAKWDYNLGKYLDDQADAEVEAGMDPTVNPKIYTSDPTWREEATKRYIEQYGARPGGAEGGAATPTAGADAGAAPPPAEGGVAKPKKSDAVLFDEGQKALWAAQGNPQKQKMIVERMRAWGLDTSKLQAAPPKGKGDFRGK